MMFSIYKRIVTHPERYLVGLVFAMFVVWATPSVLILRFNPSFRFAIADTPWDKSMQWGTMVLQMGGFALVALG